MLDDRERLLKKNPLFKIRKDKKEKSTLERAKRFLFPFLILFCLLLIGLIYYWSDASKVYRITVEGNDYLKDEEIIALSGLGEDSRFLSIVPSLVEKKIEKKPLIEEAKVSLLEGRLVKIAVKEKKIVAYVPENGMSVLVLEDGERVGLSRQEMYLIASAPIVQGFDERGMEQLVKQLAKLDRKMIAEISEIHAFPDLKYQNVELIMADGNFIFTSPEGLEILNHYFDIRSSYVSERYSCYYFEDISGNAYTSACPWESVGETAGEEEAVGEN